MDTTQQIRCRICRIGALLKKKLSAWKFGDLGLANPQWILIDSHWFLKQHRLASNGPKVKFGSYCWWKKSGTSWGWQSIPLFTGFLTSQVVVCDLFHQQYILLTVFEDPFAPGPVCPLSMHWCANYLRLALWLTAGEPRPWDTNIAMVCWCPVCLFACTPINKGPWSWDMLQSMKNSGYEKWDDYPIQVRRLSLTKK